MSLLFLQSKLTKHILYIVAFDIFISCVSIQQDLKLLDYIMTYLQI
jgi:hypothetical protein